MKSIKSKVLFFIGLILPVFSFAHSGHGVVNTNSWLHQLTSSEHLGTVVVGIIALFAFVLIYRKVRATSKK